MHNLAVYLADCLIDNEVADKVKKEEYVYGIEVLIGKMINYSSLMFIAVYFKVLIPSMFFMTAFFSLRNWTGGYHAKSAVRCYLGTIGIFTILIKGIIPFVIGNQFINVSMLALSSIIIIVMSPVNHPALCMNKDEIKKCKSTSRKVLFIEIVCISIFMVLRIEPMYVTYMIIGIVVDAALLCIAKIIKQEV